MTPQQTSSLAVSAQEQEQAVASSSSAAEAAYSALSPRAPSAAGAASLPESPTSPSSNVLSTTALPPQQRQSRPAGPQPLRNAKSHSSPSNAGGGGGLRRFFFGGGGKDGGNGSKQAVEDGQKEKGSSGVVVKQSGEATSTPVAAAGQQLQRTQPKQDVTGPSAPQPSTTATTLDAQVAPAAASAANAASNAPSKVSPADASAVTRDELDSVPTHASPAALGTAPNSDLNIDVANEDAITPAAPSASTEPAEANTAEESVAVTGRLQQASVAPEAPGGSAQVAPAGAVLDSASDKETEVSAATLSPPAAPVEKSETASVARDETQMSQTPPPETDIHVETLSGKASTSAHEVDPLTRDKPAPPTIMVYETEDVTPTDHQRDDDATPTEASATTPSAGIDPSAVDAAAIPLPMSPRADDTDDALENPFDDPPSRAALWQARGSQSTVASSELVTPVGSRTSSDAAAAAYAVAAPAPPPSKLAASLPRAEDAVFLSEMVGPEEQHSWAPSARKVSPTTQAVATRGGLSDRTRDESESNLSEMADSVGDLGPLPSSKRGSPPKVIRPTVQTANLSRKTSKFRQSMLGLANVSVAREALFSGHVLNLFLSSQVLGKDKPTTSPTAGATPTSAKSAPARSPVPMHAVNSRSPVTAGPAPATRSPVKAPAQQPTLGRTSSNSPDQRRTAQMHASRSRSRSPGPALTAKRTSAMPTMHTRSTIAAEASQIMDPKAKDDAESWYCY